MEGVVSRYLSLPFRCRELDRLLAEILIASEMYGFAVVMLHESYSILFPGRSPLKYHPLIAYFVSLSFEVLVLLVLAGAFLFGGLRGWLSQGWALALAGVPALYFLVSVTRSTFSLPSAWATNRKGRQRVAEMMQAMFSFYPEIVSSSGPISASHIRERASDISKMGVVWPPPLFALLDDVIDRTNRL
jgi:hypothetical protein